MPSVKLSRVYLPAAMAAENQRLRAENARLRSENEGLRRDNASLRGFCERARPFMLAEKHAPTQKPAASLREANEWFQKPEPSEGALTDPEAVHPQRWAVTQALLAVNEYLRPRLPLYSLTPITMLLAALADAEAGCRPALFKPRRTPKGGRPRESIARKAALAMASAAVTLLIKGGRKEQQALQEVVPALSCRPKFLKGWRDKIEQQSDLIRDQYKRFHSKWLDDFLGECASDYGVSRDEIDLQDACLRLARFYIEQLKEQKLRKPPMFP